MISDADQPKADDDVRLQEPLDVLRREVWPLMRRSEQIAKTDREEILGYNAGFSE